MKNLYASFICMFLFFSMLSAQISKIEKFQSNDLIEKERVLIGSENLNIIPQEAEFYENINLSLTEYLSDKSDDKTSSEKYRVSEIISKKGTNKYCFTYDQFGNKTSEIYFKLQNEMWEKYEKLNYEYDAFGRKIKESKELWIGDAWVFCDRTNYEFNEEGEIILILSQVMQEGDWVNKDKFTAEYKENKKVLELKEIWNSNTNVWDKLQQLEFFYDEAGRVSYYIREDWEENVSVYKMKLSYTYNTSGAITESRTENWVNNAWTDYIRSLAEYDNNGFKTKQQNENIVDNEWSCYVRYVYTNDNFGNKLTEYCESRETQGMEGQYFDTFTYDINGNMLTYWEQGIMGITYYDSFLITYEYNSADKIVSQVFSTASHPGWYGFSRTLYTYDERGNLLEKLREEKSGGVWVGDDKDVYEYDINNNCTKINFYQWNANSWEERVNTFFFYYNDDQDSKSFYSPDLQVEYITITDVNDESVLKPKYELSQNYPNPFNPETIIKFSIPKQGNVTLKIYDVLGREVITLVNEELTQGEHVKQFKADNLSSGIYYYQIKTGSFTNTKKMILLK